MSSENNDKYNLPLIKRMSVVELKNSIWSMKNGMTAVGGYPIEDYENELYLRTGSKKGYHE